MSELEKVKQHKNGHLLLGDQPLYLCLIHKGCENPPWYIENGDNAVWGEQAAWVGRWHPVMGRRAPEDPDSDLNGRLKQTLETRPYDQNNEEDHQATFDDYQLYTYTGDTDPANPKGEMPIFWKRVDPDDIPKDECEDGETPRIPRGP